MQARNETCGCRSGKKYKKCCGRFSLAEMISKLSDFVINSRRKDNLIELGLKMLAKCEATGKAAYLCLVNPKSDVEGIIDWTVVGKDLPNDEREAVVTRRVLAGYLPVGCLQQESCWRMVVNKAFVPEDLHEIYVAFARVEMALIAKTLDGKAEPEDSHMSPVVWSDRSYPGLPIKPRQPGTFKVEVDLKNRSIRVINTFDEYLDMPIEEDMIEGHNDDNDAIYVAQHVILALAKVPPPQGAIPGDIFDVYLMTTDGAPKLLARTSATNVFGRMTGEFGMGGVA